MPRSKARGGNEAARFNLFARRRSHVPACRARAAGERVRRIGVIISLAASDPQATRRATAFKQGLAEHRRFEGSSLEIAWRWAAGEPEAFQRAAAEFVELKPDVIVVASDPGTKAVSLATKSIPVVFLIVPRMIEAVIGPVRHVYGVADKVLMMALSCILIGGGNGRPRWVEVGSAMIAVDTLVHNFLHRTSSATW